ncbi:hypothetical protein BKA70DRAFT_1399850 [Coprinopsis sp. MPI-PUGE-AT-0042]|nr:hypothetical protein BKA70DRAFT_1399850 [Coprinopsis sp. MPI-PUGE-AT-0042]
MHGLFILSSVFVALVSAAPLPTLPPPFIGGSKAALLLENALEAQAANREHRLADATAPCEDATNACVAGDMAQCVGGTWKVLNSCTSAGLSCFFLPDTVEAGVAMGCTNEANALQVFEKAGATGGFLGSEGSTPAPSQSQVPSASASSAITSAVEVPAPTATAPGPVIVTQTVTVTDTEIVEATTTVELPPSSAITLTTKETISPEEASSFTQTVSATPSASSLPSASGSSSVISLSAAQSQVASSSGVASSASATQSGVTTSSSPTISLVAGQVIATLVPASFPNVMSSVKGLVVAAASIDSALSSPQSTPVSSAPAGAITSAPAQPYSGYY